MENASSVPNLQAPQLPLSTMTVMDHYIILIHIRGYVNSKLQALAEPEVTPLSDDNIRQMVSTCNRAQASRVLFGQVQDLLPCRFRQLRPECRQPLKVSRSCIHRAGFRARWNRSISVNRCYILQFGWLVQIPVGVVHERPATLAGLFFCPLPAESRLLIRAI